MPEYKGNMLGAPLPGQSLTREPGSRAYEKPSQFNTEDEAMEYLLPRLMQNAPETAAMMHKHNMPATAITESILVSGFAQGKWTPDLAALIALPVYAAVIKGVELVGGKPIRGDEEEFQAKADKLFSKLGAPEDTEDAPKEAPIEAAKGSFLGGL